MSECIFCKIVEGEIPSPRVAENEGAIAIRDINPEAPVHILIIPKAHSKDLVELSADSESVNSLLSLMKEVASTQTNGHFSFNFNTGSEAGQTVRHTHGHLKSKSDAS